MRLSKIFTLASVVLALITLPGCWSQFRGNSAHTGYNPYEHTLNVTNVGAGLFLSWAGASNAAGYPMGPISSSPAVAAVLNGSASNEEVFIGSSDGNLYAFYAFGCGGNFCGPIWSSHLGNNITDSSPAVADEVINGVQTSVVYVVANACSTCGSSLYAINAASGSTIWQVGLYGGPAYSSPNVVNGVVYVVSGDLYGAVLALDATTGTQIWQGVLGSNVASPTVSNGVVYAGDGFGELNAFDANGCAGYLCIPLWQGVPIGSGDRMDSSPAVANALVKGKLNPVVYVGSNDGYLYAYDANGVINCTTNYGHITCRPLWVGATGGGRSSPAVAPQTAAPGSGVVYVGGGFNLFAFDANGVTNCTIVSGTTTCKPLWKGTTHGFVESSPAVANGVVFVGSGDGNLYAFAAAGCKKPVCSALSTFFTNDNGGISGNSSPAVSDGWVYIGSSDGYLYALQPAPACYFSPPYC